MHAYHCMSVSDTDVTSLCYTTQLCGICGGFFEQSYNWIKPWTYEVMLCVINCPLSDCFTAGVCIQRAVVQLPTVWHVRVTYSRSWRMACWKSGSTFSRRWRLTCSALTSARLNMIHLFRCLTSSTGETFAHSGFCHNFKRGDYVEEYIATVLYSRCLHT